jgi:hypothetical protein
VEPTVTATEVQIAASCVASFDPLMIFGATLSYQPSESS